MPAPFSGALCRTADFDGNAGARHLHLVRRGLLRVTDPQWRRSTVIEACVLFIPSPVDHRLDGGHGGPSCREQGFRLAFHTAGKPTLGSSQFKGEYQGVTWHFASAANRDAFMANPAKFAPAYGGWCTAGASKGKKVMTKPAEYWAVVDGQLYLNSSDAAHNKLFLGDTAGTIRKGESNWKMIYATPADKL